MTIHVACQSTSELAPDCAVMLHSLLSANREERFVVHFLHDDGIRAADRSRLGEIVTGLGAIWEPVRVPLESLSGFPVIERYGGLTVWFRLLLPWLLQDLERVLYLDADLLVLEPIHALWETELGGACLAAATQPLLGSERRRVIRDLGLPDADRYFNSGVMVMDLDRMRSSGLMLAAAQVAREQPVALPWADQDALNVAMWSERVELHPRWNVMNPCFDLPARLLPWPAQQVREATTHPAIIHFIGPYKPWHYRLRHRYAGRYFAHLEQTPWRQRPRGEGRSVRHAVLRSLPPYATFRYEVTEYALKRGFATSMRGARKLAKLTLSRNRTLYAWGRAAYRLSSPSSTPGPLTDILDAFADTTANACFVQIGAGDAEYGDPLRPYVNAREWRGIMVEPVPYVFERLRQKFAHNSRITLVNAAVAAEDGQLPFYFLAESEDAELPEWYDKLGSFALENVLHPYHLEHIPDLADRVVCQEVRGVTFETLWKEHPLPHLDLLVIDAEGYDDQILARIDFARHRPLIIIYEHQHLDGPRRTALGERLRALGYSLLDLGPDGVAIRSDAPLPVRLAVRRHHDSHKGSSRSRFVPSGRL